MCWRSILFFPLIILAVLGFRSDAAAQELPINLPTDPVFSLYPAKIEVGLKPGERVIKTIKVINTLGYDAVFDLSVEDIGPSKNIKEPGILYGDVDGPFTVRNLVTLPYKSMAIKNGETRTVPIEIVGPIQTDVVGRYGMVLFSVSSGVGGEGESTKIISRLGATLLVKSPGKLNESGRVLSFGVIGNKIRFYDKTKSVVSQVTFKNDGNVYLNTYGIVAVKNIFGQEVAVQELDPWYVLPGSTRLREVSFGDQLTFGLYRLDAKVNRGYNDQVDELSTWVIVLPAPWISVVIMALLIGILVWFAAKRRLSQNYV